MYALACLQAICEGDVATMSPSSAAGIGGGAILRCNLTFPAIGATTLLSMSLAYPTASEKAQPMTSQAALASKLNPPASLSSQILRSGILDRVSAFAGTRLLLVQASAGFGKTTAMIQCMAHFKDQGRATAWLTLDSADDDLVRFLDCFNAALDGITGVQREGGATAEDHPVGERALAIAARMAGEPAPFALFLDDFECIQESTVTGWVREIVNRLPPHGLLVVGSRHRPDLGLGRLRAHGHLLEIGVDQLRFSKDETEHFLQRKLNVPLSSEDVDQIHARTEGWVTALWLASLALDGHDAPSQFISHFSGTDRLVADYLAEEVLARQTPQVRDFLLRTSVLRHVCVGACRALLPDVESERLLAELEKGNLFLIPIKGDEQVYRYHSLFAGFLRARLAKEFPAEVLRLHRAASEWYEHQGRSVPAIDHAIEGRDFPRALRLLSTRAPRLLGEGRMLLLARMFDAVPFPLLGDYPALQVVYVWALCFSRGPHHAMDALSRSGLLQSKVPEWQAHVRAVRPSLLLMMDRFEEAYACGEEALSLRTNAPPFANAMLANVMALIGLFMGRCEQARALLDGSRDALDAQASAFSGMYSESIGGLIDLQEGRQRQAAVRFRLAVEATRRPSSFSHHANGNAWAGVLHACSLYEANDLVQASRLLQCYVPLVKDVGLADPIILGDVVLARIAHAQGDMDRALRILTELEYSGHARRIPRVVANARLERGRLFMMQGQGSSAKMELDRAGDEVLWQRIKRFRLPASELEDIVLSRLRWQVGYGDSRAACASLGQEIDRAVAESRHRRALKLRVLLAMAHYRSGDAGKAQVIMRDILHESCAEGYVRLIVDEGPMVAVLVGLCHAQMANARSHDPTLVAYVSNLLEAFGDVADGTAVARHGQVPLPEPLTLKESRVLQLLSEGFSNRAIAGKLFVSDSTVRTHLRNVNSKLNAHSRTQAVAIARRIGIV